MQTIEVGNRSYIIGEHVEIGDGVEFGSDTVIRATRCLNR